MRTLILFTGLISMLGLGSCMEQNSEQTTEFKSLNPKDFKQQMEKEPGTVLDVRTPQEVAEGVISGAVNINLFDEDFSDRAAKLDKNKPVYVYCKVGGRSANAAGQLVGMGFKEVYNLTGGMDAWKAAGLETTTLKE